MVNADGSAVSHWRRPDGTWLSSVPSLGVDALWGVTAQGFVAWDAFGREMDTYRAIGIGHMRDVAGVRSGGYVALVASGNGDRSLVAIYDRCRRLVYEEVYAGLTYTIAASPAGDAIFVGAGERVLRYRLSRPPPGGLEACVGATERLLSDHAPG